MRVAVLGVGKIGKFHVREYVENHCEVVAILSSTKERAEQKAKEINSEFSLNVKPYWNLKDLLSNEKLDSVSICTPSWLHNEQTLLCLKNKLNVLCEKPFIVGEDNVNKAKKLFALSKKNKVVLAVNTQWPFVLDFINEEVDLKSVKNYSIEMELGLEGEGLLTEGLPHANSLLLRIIKGSHKVTNLKFTELDTKKIGISFFYGSCFVSYFFSFKAERPRNLRFSINEVFFKKNISNFSLETPKKEIKIGDPFKMSLRDFIDSSKEHKDPFISSKEVIRNLEIQNQILDKYSLIS